MLDLLCVGLAVCDIIAAPVSPTVFEKDTVILEQLVYKPGGDAFNVAAGAAKAGLRVSLAACVGDDPAGGMLREAATACGVETENMIVDSEQSTATSIVLVDPAGERHFAYNPGANYSLCEEHLPDQLLQQARHLHVSGAMLLKGLDGEGIASLFRRAQKNGLTTSMDVAFDPEGLWLQKIEKALYFTDYFFPSLEEAQCITGCETPEEIAKALSRFSLKLLVIKMGAAGCYLYFGGKGYPLPAVEMTEITDTTGAGDCFVAVLLAALLQGIPPIAGAVFATVGAGCCLKQVGADCGFQDFRELERLANVYRETYLKAERVV